MAGLIRPLPPTAKITASAPRPSVNPRTVLHGIRLGSINRNFKPKLLAIVSLAGYKSEVITRAPARLANVAKINADRTLPNHQHGLLRLQAEASQFL